MNVVDFRNIHHSYQRGADVLDGVTFDIEPGRFRHHRAMSR